MNHLVRGLMVIGITVTGLVTTGRSVHAESSKADEVTAAYIVDAKSGQVVYARNANDKLPIASLSKLMTLYLVEQAVKTGQIKWTDTVPTDKHVQKMASSATLSTMPMSADDRFTVKELFAATLVGSSNSSAIALGEYVAGNNAKFIKLMNQQADKWAIDAKFVSASGLDNTDLSKYDLDLPHTSATAQNLVSAKAITVIAQHLVEEFPDVLTVANVKAVNIHKYRVPTSVKILKGEKYYDPRVPVDGLKTGYTNQAGACLVATFEQDGHRMIATTLGGAWPYTANNNLRLMLKDQERQQDVAARAIKYQIPGTQTSVRLVTDDHLKMWTNSAHPVQQTQEAVWPLHRTKPNYLGANTTVLKVHLTDPQSGTTRTLSYHTEHAVSLQGPMQWATKVTTASLPLNHAFAIAE